MYSSEKYFCKTSYDLIELISNKTDRHSNMAIVGGHFMLFYDKESNMLKPVIWQELTNQQHIQFAKLQAGNFPLDSLKYSIELYKINMIKDIKSGVILMVNDHKFQSYNFQPDIIELVQGRGGDLRKEYFHKNIVPECYLEEIKNNSIQINDILIHNDNIKRKANELLPKKSWYYSETRLKNRFEYYVQDDLLAQGKIKKESTSNGNEIVFETSNLNDEICLSENGSCSCSAELIEFVHNVFDRGFTEIVIFVPNECASAVDGGILASLQIYNIKGKVWTVSNFGGMGVTSTAELELHITLHCNE